MRAARLCAAQAQKAPRLYLIDQVSATPCAQMSVL